MYQKYILVLGAMRIETLSILNPLEILEKTIKKSWDEFLRIYLQRVSFIHTHCTFKNQNKWACWLHSRDIHYNYPKYVSLQICSYSSGILFPFSPSSLAHFRAYLIRCHISVFLRLPQNTTWANCLCHFMIRSWYWWYFSCRFLFLGLWWKVGKNFFHYFPFLLY